MQEGGVDQNVTFRMMQMAMKWKEDETLMMVAKVPHGTMMTQDPKLAESGNTKIEVE